MIWVKSFNHNNGVKNFAIPKLTQNVSKERNPFQNGGYSYLWLVQTNFKTAKSPLNSGEKNSLFWNHLETKIVNFQKSEIHFMEARLCVDAIPIERHYIFSLTNFSQQNVAVLKVMNLCYKCNRYFFLNNS